MENKEQLKEIINILTMQYDYISGAQKDLKELRNLEKELPSIKRKIKGLLEQCKIEDEYNN